MVCPLCELFRGDPCNSCRTASRIIWTLRTQRFHPSQEQAVVTALRECAGALTDLAELSGRFRGEVAVKLQTAEEVKAAAAAAKEEREDKDTPGNSGNQASGSGIRKHKEKKPKKDKKESASEEGREKKRKKEKKHKEEDHKEDTEVKEEIVEEEEPDKCSGEKEAEPLPLKEEELTKKGSAKEKLESIVDKVVSANPSEFGLSPWPVDPERENYVKRQRERSPVRRPHPPDHPPPDRVAGPEGRDHGAARRRGRKRNKGQKRKERGIQRSRWGYGDRDRRW